MQPSPHPRASDDEDRRVLLAADRTSGLVVEADVELEAAWGLPGDLKGLPVRSLFEQQTAREAVLRHAVSEFLFTAVHDLNSPMRQVGLLAALLREELGESSSPASAELLNNLDRAARKAIHLTERLKSYAEAVTAAPSIVDRVDLGVVAEQAVKAVKLWEHGSVGPVGVHSGPALVRCDEDLTRIALEKLLENAVHFQGGSPLEVKLEARRTGPDWELAVSDNGRGIDPEDAPRLFRPFRRMQARETRGSGLGLAIAQALLSLQAGRLWLDTGYTAGARFVLTLPAA